MDSIFRPGGAWPDGLWLEQTGPLCLGLVVEVINGGWHWRCRKVWLYGVRLPRWLFPRSDAYKCIVDGQYRFQVTFMMPLLGVVLGYGGLLESQAPRLTQ